MSAESIAGLVIVFIAIDVIVEGPLAAALDDEMTDLIVLVAPESANPTGVFVGFPCCFVDMAVFVERRRKLIAVISAAGRKILIAGKFKSNAVHGC